MVSAQFCPACETNTAYHVETRQETHAVRGVPITVEARVAICDRCGLAIEDETLDSATLECAYTEYRRKFNIISPDQIHAMRERYGLSQRALARLLNWGDMTIHRYETGAVPDFVHNDLLLMLQDNEAMRRFIEQHQDRLTSLDKQRVAAAIAAQRLDMAPRVLVHTLEIIMDQHSLAARGNRPFEFERFGQMVVYFTASLHERIAPTRVKLLKLLYYADFLAYKRLSLSLSGAAYRRLPLGPVPDRYATLLAEVESQGMVVTEDWDFITAEGTQTGTRYQALVPFDASLFKSAELAVLRAVCDQLGSLTAKQISEKSHGERGWEETPSGEIIPYATAQDLSLN